MKNFNNNISGQFSQNTKNAIKIDKNIILNIFKSYFQFALKYWNSIKNIFIINDTNNLAYYSKSDQFAVFSTDRIKATDRTDRIKKNQEEEQISVKSQDLVQKEEQIPVKSQDLVQKEEQDRAKPQQQIRQMEIPALKEHNNVKNLEHNKKNKTDHFNQKFQRAQAKLEGSMKKNEQENPILNRDASNKFGTFDLAGEQINVFIRKKVKASINQYNNSGAIIERMKTAIAKGFVEPFKKTGIKLLIDNNNKTLQVGDFQLCEVKLLGNAMIGNVPADDYRIISVFNVMTKNIWMLEEVIGHKTMKHVITNILCKLQQHDFPEKNSQKHSK